MKIGIVGPENEFVGSLQEKLRTELPGDELVGWKAGAAVPAGDLDVLIAIGAVDRAMLQGQPRLVLVQTASDGYDKVDVQAATELGIWVSYSPGGASGNADAVAEYAVMLLIAANRRLGEALRFVEDHAQPRPMLTPGLVGKTVCIYGYGDIGKRVAARLRPFGVKLTAVNRHAEGNEGDVRVYGAEQRAEALGAADAVVLCVRGSAENRHLVDAAFLAEMKAGSTLVNVARGSLVDEAALLKAMQSGHVGAAGLDVQEHEPVDPANPLLKVPSAFVTPHIAGFTEQMLEGTTRYLVEVVGKVRARERFDSLLNEPKSPRLVWKG